jgi:hypothetical protein
MDLPLLLLNPTISGDELRAEVQDADAWRRPESGRFFL